ncbi:ATP-binding protein [Kitasatospora sp. NPDC056273]|uniref:ATP-binding protein n=1 Tax=Kitasatospora sp. NPDC056273 TaxID=3345769 RepID=UPI0035D86C25
MRIPVEVKPDFIEKVARRTDPVGAVEELVWNSLDADATRVEIDLELNDLGGLAAVIIRDNGHGIPSASATDAFSGMGGSWKRAAPGTHGGRQLHGRNGYGRFRVLALGSTAQWSSVAESPDGTRECITINFNDGSSIFNLDSQGTSTADTGTTIRITGEAQRKTRLLDSEATLTALNSRFAIYLNKYPAVQILWRGTALNPAEAVLKEFTEPLDVGAWTAGEPPMLRIVEWRVKPPKRELLICDSIGVHRLTLAAGIQAPDFHFTAYVLGEQFAGLTDHDSLEGEFEHTDSILGMAVQAARTRLRSYFRERERERTKDQVRQWIEEEIYPYNGEAGSPVETAERTTFDEVATLISRHIQGAKAVKRTQMVLLREALRRQPTAMPRVLDELFNLSQAQKEKLEELVDKTPLSNLIATNAQTIDRLDFLTLLRTLLFGHASRQALREKDQLHRMLEKELWVFGDQYASAVSEIGLTEALERHLSMLDEASGTPTRRPPQQVRRADGSSGRLDLMLSAVVGAGDDKRHLVVELKRPNLTLTDKEITQVRSYAYTVTNDQRFRHDQDVKWDFWLVGNEIAPAAQWQINASNLSDGRLQDDGRVSIRVVRWGEILDNCEERLRKQQERLNYASTQARAAEYAGRVHSDANILTLVNPRSANPSA